MPKVSIIIPTYNRAHFLSDAIASALGQTFADIEVIVVDDGSTDNTHEVVAGFSDERVLYVYQENQGATAAFNTGIEKSSGEYVSILGADDWYLPNGLAPLFGELEQRSEIGVAAGGYIMVDEVGNEIKEMRPWLRYPCLDVNTWLFACPVLLQAALIRRGWVEKVGRFDTAIKGPQDWDFGLRLAYAGCQMAWVGETVFCYRLHSENSVRDASAARQDVMAILDKFFANPELPSKLIAVKDSVYIQAYLNVAGQEYAVGQIEEARRDLAHAIQLDPGLLANEGERLFHTFAWWSQSPTKTRDPVLYLRTVLDNLPESAAKLGRLRRKALAELAAVQFFQAYGVGDRRTVRRAALDMMLHDPARMFDRGVASICVESLVGTQIARQMRKLFRRLSKRSSLGA